MKVEMVPFQIITERESESESESDIVVMHFMIMSQYDTLSKQNTLNTLWNSYHLYVLILFHTYELLPFYNKEK